MEKTNQPLYQQLMEDVRSQIENSLHNNFCMSIRTVNRDCYCTAVWIVADAILKKICNRPL